MIQAGVAASLPFHQAIHAGKFMSDISEEPSSPSPKTIKKDWDPGASGKPQKALFTPEEMDLYVNKITLEAYIFHGKDVDYKILERLEYNPADHSVTVVKKDGTRLDLGIKIQWLLRPYFTKAKEISIVQTKNGESVDGIVIPLIHKDKNKAG